MNNQMKILLDLIFTFLTLLLLAMALYIIVLGRTIATVTVDNQTIELHSEKVKGEFLKNSLVCKDRRFALRIYPFDLGCWTVSSNPNSDSYVIVSWKKDEDSILNLDNMN